MMKPDAMMWYICFFVLLVISFASGQSIIAVDVGTEFFKVVLVQPGKMFDIAMSPDSKRKSYSAIGILDDIRSYGSEAFNTYGKKPTHVAWRVRDMLGKPASALKEDLKRQFIHTEVKPSADGTNTIVVELAVGTKDQKSFPPAELFAMLMVHARDMGEKHGNTKVSSIVLTVPSFFTHAQKQSILDAAEIAGLTVLGLIDENTAAMVHFAQERTFNSTERILVFNQGAASTQVSVFEVSGGKDKKTNKEYRKVVTLSKAWDETLGSQEMDLLLANHFASDFEKKHPKSNIRDSARAMVRLKKEGKLVKEILSGLDRFPVAFQQLHNDVDYRGEVTRAQLEDMAKQKGLIAAIEKPILEALAGANLTAKDLTAIEIVGGGVRVPSVRNEIKRVLQATSELSTHINGDEGMAFGAAFFGANVSKSFKVPRVVWLQDALAREVRLRLLRVGEEEGGVRKDKDVALFKRFALVEAKEASVEKVKFKHDGDFDMELYELVGGAEVAVGGYRVTGAGDAIAKELSAKFGEAKIYLSFSLNRMGMVALASAEARWEEEYEEAAEEAKKANESSGGAENATVVKKKRTHRHVLTSVLNEDKVPVKRLSAEAKAEAQARLIAWDLKDRTRARLDAVRNDLEAFSFTSKDRLASAADKVKVVLSEDDLAALHAELSGVEDFIHESKHVTEVAHFEAKRRELGGKVDRVFRLLQELEERPKAITALTELVAAVEARRANWTEERPWVPLETLAHVDQVLLGVKEWLKTKAEEQAALSARQDPVLTLGGIRGEMEKVQKAVERVLTMRKPVVEKKEEPANKTDEAETDNTQREGDEAPPTREDL